MMGLRLKNGLDLKIKRNFLAYKYFENKLTNCTIKNNFLICNNAVLVPTYDCPQDEEALNVIKTCFPDREVVGVDCQVLIKQHGSLHCVTMQYPCGVA